MLFQGEKGDPKEDNFRGVRVTYRRRFQGGLLPVFKTSITACIGHLLPTVGQMHFFSWFMR